MMTGVRTKGAAIKNTLLAIERLHRKDGLDRVRAAMPEGLREASQRVLPVEWYPVELTAAVHAAIKDTLGNGKWDESHRVAGEAARIEMNGAYRVMIRAVQYDTVWDRMERMWSQFYDRGEAKWGDRGRGHATAVIRGVAGFNEGMWQSIAGRIEVLLQVTGSRGAATTIKAAAATHGTIEALWLE